MFKSGVSDFAVLLSFLEHRDLHFNWWNSDSRSVWLRRVRAALYIRRRGITSCLAAIITLSTLCFFSVLCLRLEGFHKIKYSVMFRKTRFGIKFTCSQFERITLNTQITKNLRLMMRDWVTQQECVLDSGHQFMFCWRVDLQWDSSRSSCEHIRSESRPFVSHPRNLRLSHFCNHQPWRTDKWNLLSFH